VTEKAKAETDLFSAYVGGKKILLADSSPSSRSSISRTLTLMGAKGDQLVLAPTYASAEEAVQKHKPRIAICDYDLGRRCGLDLFQRVRAEHPDMKDGLFVLVTGNTSQSAVAHAAEEDVDTYILKPFTSEVLRNSLLKAVTLKVKPPSYLVAIEKGKKELAENRIEDAIKSFEEAMRLDPAPALACFYLGQTNVLKKLSEGAKERFSEGLSYNKIHYKCMVGLYEVLLGEKRHQEAYDVVKRIAQYYPANPTRLTSVLRLAILTASYDDVERYYHLFTNLDERNIETVKYVCAALVVCGKYYLGHNSPSRAVALFEKAVVTAAGSTRILREIIQAFVDADMLKPAKTFLGRFPAATHGGPDFLAMDLLVQYRSGDLEKTIERGREILARGVQDPSIYLTLIRASAEAGSVPAAEELAGKATGQYPEQKAQFAEALASAKVSLKPAVG
jgi:DNA-binding NarL/FixJ family response regulator